MCVWFPEQKGSTYVHYCCIMVASNVPPSPADSVTNQYRVNTTNPTTGTRFGPVEVTEIFFMGLFLVMETHVNALGPVKQPRSWKYT